MRRALTLGAALVAGLLTMGTAGADDAGCAASFERINAILIGTGRINAPIGGEVRAMGQDGCRVAPIVTEIGPRMMLKADALEWTGTGLERFEIDGLPPQSLEMTLSRLRLVAVTDLPALTYLMERQSARAPIEARLAFDWDRESDRLDLTELGLSFSNGDFARFSAQIDGVDLTDFSTIRESAGTAELVRSTIDVRSYGLFESTLLVPLGMALLDGAPDPEARVNELKVLWLAEIMALPEPQFDHGAKMALSALLSDMPNPEGRLTIELTADPGLGMARFMALAAAARTASGLSDLSSLLDGVRYAITYGEG